VPEQAYVPEGFNAELEVGDRTPGKSLFGEKEPEGEGNDEANEGNHIFPSPMQTMFYPVGERGRSFFAFRN
jgi:hypothetical protein